MELFTASPSWWWLPVVGGGICSSPCSDLGSSLLLRHFGLSPRFGGFPATTVGLSSGSSRVPPSGYRRFTPIPLGFVVPLLLVFAGLVAGDSSIVMGDDGADLRRKARSGASVRTRSGRRDVRPFPSSVFGSMALCGGEECRGVSCCFWAVGVGSDRLFTMLYLSTGVGSGLLLVFSQCIVACFVVLSGRSLGLCLSSTSKDVFFMVPFGTFRSLTLLVSTQDNTRWALSHDGPTLGVYSITVSMVVSMTLTISHRIV